MIFLCYVFCGRLEGYTTLPWGATCSGFQVPVSWLADRRKLARQNAIVNSVAAVSVGVIDGEPRLDLAYEEDVRAGTDMNVVCTGDGGFVEVQGTAEGAVFDRPTLDSLLDLATLIVCACARLPKSSEIASQIALR